MQPCARSFELTCGVAISAGVFERGGTSDLSKIQCADILAIALVDGALLLCSHGREIRVGAGEALLVRPGEATILNSIESSGGIALSVATERLSDAARRACASLGAPLDRVEALLDEAEGACVAHCGSELMSAAARLVAASREDDVARIRLCTLELASTIVAGLEGSTAAIDVSGSHRRIADAAARAMRDRLDQPKTIPTLARICGTSPTILKESFREVYGMPVYAWYRRLRMEAASRRLIHGGESIAEVALSVGYSNPSKFAKAFGETMGMTPREWRRTMASTRVS